MRLTRVPFSDLNITYPNFKKEGGDERLFIAL
jgi:hypothetical protein